MRHAANNRSRLRLIAIALAGCLTMTPAPTATAQQFALAQAPAPRAPRFLLTRATRNEEPTPLDVRRTPALMQRISVRLEGVPLKSALSVVSSEAGLTLIYADGVLPANKRVSLLAEQISVVAALTDLLADLDVDVVFDPRGGASLVRRADLRVVFNGSIAGRVVDSTSGEGVAAATVSLEGARNRVNTSASGHYSLREVTPGPHVLSVRRLGYRSQTRSVTVEDSGTATVNVTVARVPTVLNEIVATATGDRQRIELGNSVGTIKADSIVPVALIRNMSDLLQARTPSVVVSNVDGSVGVPSKIRIRGINSVQLNNDPIIVVDGVRVQWQTTAANSQMQAGARAGTQNVNVGLAMAGFVPDNSGGTRIGSLAPSRLDDLDPSSIESIDVLRGPSAATLYGTEAANGVILIKTKRGVAGNFRTTISADQGTSRVPGSIPGRWRGWGRNFAGATLTQCQLFDPRFSSGSSGSSASEGSCMLDSVTTFSAADHPDLSTLGTGSSRSLALGLSGGSTNVQEFISLHASDAVGVAKMSAVEERRARRMWGTEPPSWVKRPNSEKSISGLSRTNFRVSRDLDFSLTANGIYRNVLGGLAALPNTRGGGDVQGNFTTNLWSASDTLFYLPSEIQRTKQTNVAKRGLLAATGNYNPLSWLALRGTVGGDYTMRQDDALNDSDHCTSALQANILGPCAGGHGTFRGETMVSSFDIGAVVTTPITGWLLARTSVGEQYSRTKFSGLSASNGGSTTLAFGTDLLSPTPVPVPGITATIQLVSVSESRDESVTAGWYVEEMAAIRDRLFLTAALRQDAASSFGPAINDKPPVYPKLGASWVMSEETFFEPVRTRGINSFRLRLAYGHSGNQASQADVLNNFTMAQGVNAEGFQALSVTLAALGNPALRPERTKEWEGGFDLALFRNDRLTIEATAYRKISEDAIISATNPPSFGVSSLAQRFNLGSVENRGFELSATGHVVDTRPVTWSATIQHSRNRNKLVEKDPRLGDGFSGFSQLYFKVGYPVYGRWGNRITSYADVNGDGMLSVREVTWTDTLVFFGAPYPKSETSMHNTISLLRGAFSINSTMNYVAGLTNSLDALESAGWHIGAQGFFDPKAPLSVQATAMQALRNRGFISQSSTLRLSELSFAMHAPASLARRARVGSASVIVAGRNLALWTNYHNKDPNVDTSWQGSFGSGRFGDAGSDNGSGLPQTRNWILRLNLGF